MNFFQVPRLWVAVCATIAFSEAWMMPTTTTSSLSTAATPRTRKQPKPSTTTLLMMFDWMKPKNTEGDKPNDFFGSMFKPSMQTAATTTTTAPSKEVVASKEVQAEKEVIAEVPTKLDEEEKSTPVEAKKEKLAEDQQPVASWSPPDAVESAKVKEERSEVAPVAVSPSSSTTTTASSTDETSTAIHKGKVRWFDAKRGYGFIDFEESGSDAPIFVHQSAIHTPDPNFWRKLYPKELVEFQLGHDDNGRIVAIHVTGPDGSEVKYSLKQQRMAAAQTEV